MRRYLFVFFVKLNFLVFVLIGCNSRIKSSKGYYYYTNGNQIYDTNQLAFLIEKENNEEMTSDFQAKIFQTKTTFNQKWLFFFNKRMQEYRKNLYQDYCLKFPHKRKLIDSIKTVESHTNCLLYVINNQTKEVEHFSVNGRVNKNFKDIEIRNSRLIGTLAAFENGKDLSDNCYSELTKAKFKNNNLTICPHKTLEHSFMYNYGVGSKCRPPYSYLNWFEILKCNMNLKSEVNTYSLKSNYNLWSLVTTDVYAELNLFKSLRNKGILFNPKVLYDVKKSFDNKLSFKKSTFEKMERLLDQYMIKGNGNFFYVNDYLKSDSWCILKAINVYENVLIYSSSKYTILLIENSHLRFGTSFFPNRKHSLITLLSQLLKDMKIDQKEGEMSFKAKKYHNELEKSYKVQF